MPRQARFPAAAISLLRGLAIGTLAAFPAALLAIVSAGAGHGDYVFARLLFPYSMLLTRVVGERITTPLIWLAFLQYPIYGAVLGIAGSRRRTVFLGALLIAHAAAAAACFAGALPNFQ